MEMYDLLMLAIFVAAIVFGAVKGLAWQIASAAALVGSYVVALAFYPSLQDHINAEPPWNQYLAMFILYIGTSFAVWVGFAFVRRMIEKVEMKDFDRQAGAVLGAINGVVVCLLVTFFAVTLPFLSDEQKSGIGQTRSGQIMATAVEQLALGLPEDVDQVVRPYLERLDENLRHPEADAQRSLPAGTDASNEGSRGSGIQIPGAGGANPDWKPWETPDWKRFADQLQDGLQQLH